jgi:hypothetical protein
LPEISREFLRRMGEGAKISKIVVTVRESGNFYYQID